MTKPASDNRSMEASENRFPNYLPVFRLAPNVVTLIALCVALSAIRFAFQGDWPSATAFLLIAGFLDGIDGRLARFLNSCTDFGAQLDSLVDFVNFGVVPGFVVYMWINQYDNIKGFDWAMVLFFAICMSVRLARFNVGLTKKVANPLLEKYFFKGIPAPCGAAMTMLPMVLSYEFGTDYFFTDPVFVIFYIFILALLSASTIPTISIKKIPVRNDYVYATLLLISLIIVGIVARPWFTLAVIGVVYVFSIPVTALIYFKIKMST